MTTYDREQGSGKTVEVQGVPRSEFLVRGGVPLRHSGKTPQKRVPLPGVRPTRDDCARDEPATVVARCPGVWLDRVVAALSP